MMNFSPVLNAIIGWLLALFITTAIVTLISLIIFAVKSLKD